MASADRMADGPPLEPMLRRLEYWQTLTPEDRVAILKLPHSVRTLEPHHYIAREYDRTEYCWVMLAGFAIRHKVVAGGHRQILSIHMKGDLVDLQNSLLGRADHSVQMLTAGNAAMISRQEIERIAFERPAVGKALWIDTLVDGSIFRDWIPTKSWGGMGQAAAFAAWGSAAALRRRVWRVLSLAEASIFAPWLSVR